MCDVSDDDGRAVAEALSAEGHEVEFLAADVSDAEQARSLTDAALERWGSLDVLVNNAAIQVEKTIEDTEPEDWDRLMSVNLRGVYRLLAARDPGDARERRRLDRQHRLGQRFLGRARARRPTARRRAA